MQARVEDLEALLKLQQIDLEIMQANKQLIELPQRKVILEARKKRKVINSKYKQVEALKKEAAKRLTFINDEDDSLVKKENGVQAALKAAGGDFRNVEARQKELDGITKRRANLAEERAQIDSELEKITNLELQLAEALEEIDKKELEATESFQEEGGALKSKVVKLEAERDEAQKGIDEAIIAEYEKVSERTGNVGVGRLIGTQCGVCRTNIDGGRLIQLRAEAPLGKCPFCHRLLVIDEVSGKLI